MAVTRPRHAHGRRPPQEGKVERRTVIREHAEHEGLEEKTISLYLYEVFLRVLHFFALFVFKEKMS
jgi:hypothetical protein